MTSTILVVDDEETICMLLSRVLVREGYRVLKTTHGQEALQILLKEKPDLMILDLNLPDLSGEMIYKNVRQTPQTKNIPILIITGRTVPGLSARCLNGGADAFISKPFDTGELLAYIRALLRRSSVYAGESSVIEKDGVAIEPGRRRVLLQGMPIEHLSPKEFDVLKELVIRSPNVVAKEDLAARVWGTPLDVLHSRTLDVHIRRIRQKVGIFGARCLKTIPAIGYQWLAKS